ncbi:MAG TPA: L-histidine N(alpha)-methyltransferase [Candidatus Rubrimentiphilum sp.]|nr:L-histidine N(alpha)-methyltransferase [Candidatus Rubrimentiphilum sp.]
MPAATTAPMDRLQIVTVPQPHRLPSFAEEVAAGLGAGPKRLNSKYFYDAVGSALFDAITQLPEYYLTRAETAILREWGWEIVRALGNPVEFVELGSGSAAKTRILIEEALRVQRALRYSPIDISADALRASAGSLVESYPELRVTGYAADYFSILDTPHLRRSDQKVLFMFMGSNIGNYEPKEAAALLTRIAALLKPGDGLLLGADLKKDERDLRLAYDDPAGVTAAFNKNLLVRINRELGADFNVRSFSHVVEYDEKSGGLHSYLQAESAQDVTLARTGTRVHFEKGERIHTESAYKYSLEGIGEMARASGMHVARTWQDEARRFSVNLLVLAS